MSSNVPVMNESTNEMIYEMNHILKSSDEGRTLETSAFRISVRWPIYIINSVDKSKYLYTTSPPRQHHKFFRNYPLLARIIAFIT